MTRPDILLLDEPTVGLDPLMEAELQSLAREAAGRGQTVFLSSHLLDEVEYLCHRVAILRSGVLVEVAALDDLRRLTTTIFEASLSWVGEFRRSLQRWAFRGQTVDAAWLLRV
jgi:ABC-2 type transport system ATP-binding protein